MRRAAVLLLLLGGTWLTGACEGKAPGAYAKRVERPEELLGGRGALGAVGDWIIGNQHFRVVIQDQGWSRGFGIFGGGIIDADIVRPGERGDRAAFGRDNFGEYFPAIFLQAFDVADQMVPYDATKDVLPGKGVVVADQVKLPAIEVIADGSDGGAAILRTRASGGDFLTIVGKLVDLALPEAPLIFETDYIVRPGTRHVEIVGRLKNLSLHEPYDLAGGTLGSVLETLISGSLQMPLGDVALFGGGNHVFAPGAVTKLDGTMKPMGFDIRFSVEQAYDTLASYGVTLPALPGIVVDFLATAGPGVSYGFVADDSERNYVWVNRDQYGLEPLFDVTPHSMLVPFLLESFTGAYFAAPPPELTVRGTPGDTFEYKRFFVVGDGDVSSIRDEIFDIRNVDTGTFEGVVVDTHGEPEVGAWVHVFDALNRPYTQVEAREGGRFRCRLEAGTYTYRVTAEGRSPYPDAADAVTTAFTLSTDTLDPYSEEGLERLEAEGAAPRSVYRRIEIPPAAELVVHVRDEIGRPVPAKVSVVGHYSESEDGKEPMEFLFDFSLGEERRSTDLTWRDAPGERRREYLETYFFAAAGEARGLVRPSPCGTCPPYDVYISRGPEYDSVVHRGVVMVPGQRVNLDAVLKRVIDTKDYIAADLHVHTQNSVDSFSKLETQITAGAAEGLELAVATDHNYTTQLAPTIAKLGLEQYITSIVGVELSTLEMGHFNAFPIVADPSVPSRFPFVTACHPPDLERGKVNQTSFDWVQCNPQQLFDNVRSLGLFGPSDTIVQVNHPRDSILGYFGQFYMNPYTAQPETPDILNHPETGFFIQPHNDQTNQWEPENFSFDFDAIEFFNGKRLDLVHAFVMPEIAPDEVVAQKQDYQCGSGHPDNGRGKVLLRKGGHPAFPGGADDWMNLLRLGHRFTGTANSDSHGTSEELGNPRTYLYLSPGEEGARRDEDLGQVTPIDVVESIRSHRAILSNGPFIELRVRTRSLDAACAERSDEASCEADNCDWYEDEPNCRSRCALFSNEADCNEGSCAWDPDGDRCRSAPLYFDVGDTVRYSSDNTNRLVDFEVRVQSAPWVEVDYLKVWVNGEVLRDGDGEERLLQLPEGTDDDTVIPFSASFQEDVFILVEAYGDESLFPYITPREDPPANVGEVVQGLAGNLVNNLSFGGGDGISGPGYIQKVRPYAVTNPIWLDIDASGQFDPPGPKVPVAPAPDEPCPERQVRSIPPEVVGQFFFMPAAAPRHTRRADLRRIIGGLGSHTH